MEIDLYERAVNVHGCVYTVAPWVCAYACGVKRLCWSSIKSSDGVAMMGSQAVSLLFILCPTRSDGDLV